MSSAGLLAAAILLAATVFSLDTLSAADAPASADVLRGLVSNWDAAGLDVWINDRDANEVRLGDKIEFHFQSTAVGYLSIAYIDSSGSAAVIVPSQDDEPELTAAGVEQVYPSPTAGFQFRAVPPAGMETAFLVLTDRPIRPSSIGNADAFGFLQSDESAALLESFVAAVNEIAKKGLVAVAEIRQTSVAPPPGDAAPGNVAAVAADLEPAGGMQREPAAAEEGRPATHAAAAAAETNGPARTAGTAERSGAGEVAGSATVSAPEVAGETGGTVSSVPGLPDLPGTGEIVAAAGVPATGGPLADVPALPAIPDAPQAPTTSEVLTAAGLPASIPATDMALPGGANADLDLPDVPDVTDIVAIPDVPGASDIINVPSIPGPSDVVNLPTVSVPAAPTPADISGNVLGRVMSPAQSLPTSASEVRSTARQIAIATATRKVFEAAFGGGDGRPAGSQTGLVGVRGVIVDLESNPDRLNALALEKPGAVGAIRMLGRASDPDLELELTLRELESEIEKASEVYYCTDVSDCHALPMGEDACGNARKYVIYTATTTDVDALTGKVRDFNSYDTVRQLAESQNSGDVSCDGPVAAPDLVCERNICDAIERKP